MTNRKEPRCGRPEEIAEEIVKEWHDKDACTWNALPQRNKLKNRIAQAIERERAERLVVSDSSLITRLRDENEKLWSIIAQAEKIQKEIKQLYPTTISSEIKAALANRRTISEEVLEQVREALSNNQFIVYDCGDGLMDEKNNDEIHDALYALDKALLKASTDAEGDG